MQKKFKHLLQQISNSSILKIGITETTKQADEKKIYLVNVICILHLVSFILSIIIGLLFNRNLIQLHPLLGYLLITSLIFFVFCLQHIQKYFLAKTLFILSSFFTCFIFDVYILPNVQANFFYITPVLVSLTIYNSKIPPLSFLILGILLFSDVFHFKGEVDMNKIHLNLLFLITFFITYFLIETNKKAEKKLLEQQLELERLHEFKSHFFVNLSHEIRTPLTLIKGYTNKLDFEKPAVYNLKQKKIINEQINDIQYIVDTIMDMGKIDENKLMLKIEHTDLNSFLLVHYDQFKNEFERKGIEFKIMLPQEKYTIKCDSVLFSKSINNLLNNALKFTPKNGIVTIEVTINDNLKIAITDTGIGIPENELTNIFERYYQVKNDITESKGTGIGLSFTKNILDTHGFNISVNSILEEFTSFTITIPTNNYSLKEKESVAMSTTITTKKPNTILIVDDHKQMKMYIGNLLQNNTILYAENGKEALEIVESGTIDLIITDYMMPVMNGYEFVKHLKKAGNKIPILIITASKNDEYKLNMLRLGIDGYLNKPFLEEELQYAVQKSLGYYQVIKNTEIEGISSISNSSGIKDQMWIENLQYEIKKGIERNTFGIDELAEKLKLSKSSLNRKTKLLLGQTPNELVIETRVLKAIEIKNLQPNISQRDLAKSVGLKNASYLIKRIKNYN